MPFFVLIRRVLLGPVGASALVAVLIRGICLAQSWAANPLVSHPQLDSYVYLAWARDIAGGDLVGRSGFIGGRPLFFNPLYAYVLAPFFEGVAPFPFPVPEDVTRALSGRILAVLVAQALLGGATAALTAAAARRHLGAAAAWIAGMAVALSAALVQLDAHLAVSGLGAFLVAGTAYACAPALPGEGGPKRWWAGARGPLAAGLWLGVGALARPVSVLAMPLVALHRALRSPRRWRAGALVGVVFFACAVPTLVRNAKVGGEAFLYTAAGGLNVHLGNNPAARRYRTMATDHFQFDPLRMHDDARRYVHSKLGRAPTWKEVDGYFGSMAREQLVEHPGPSAAHYATKARWFLSPVEVPSSASMATDRSFAWTLYLAFVPTWLLAALGLVGFWLHRRDRDLLLGPGALVAAHVAILTLVFPLSHYQSPAIPALAIGAAGAVTWAVGRYREGRRGAAGAAFAGAVLLAGVGALPPQPDPMGHTDAVTLSYCYLFMARGETSATPRRDELLSLAEAAARTGIDRYAAAWPNDSFAAPWYTLAQVAGVRGDDPGAAAHFRKALALEPQNWPQRLNLSVILERMGDLEGALREAQRVLEDVEAPQAYTRISEVAFRMGRVRQAQDAARRAYELGGPKPNWVQ